MVVAATANIAHFVKSGLDETLRFEIVKDNTRFIILAGKPSDEPIANYGHFIMNSKDQL
jgi:redox-sensitive bicupin YhaK (pirin superfamily)